MAMRKDNTLQGLGYTMGLVGTDILMIDNKKLLCIVDYYSKFPALRRVESLSAKDLIRTAKVVFAEFGLPKKLV